MERHNYKGEAREIQKFLEMHGIIGKSTSMIELGDSIIRFGRTDLNSRRGKYPFVTVDIPNIPKELFQSELFGHNKGSFSGAIDTKKGLFQQAHKGTLFLDEIGDISPQMQVKLLRVLQE